MFTSMSYPVGPQPKSLQSVTPASTFFLAFYGMRASGFETAKTLAHSIFRDNTREILQLGQIYMLYTVVLKESIIQLDKRETCVNC